MIEQHTGAAGTKIYTTGYTGRDRVYQPLDTKELYLAELVVRLDAVLVDIRMSPRSRYPSWRQPNLQALHGHRYVHIPELGNVNYNRPAPIQIADLDEGIRKLLELTRLFPAALLLCGCEEPEDCHRTVVADALRSCSWVQSVQEIWRWDPIAFDERRA